MSQSNFISVDYQSIHKRLDMLSSDLRIKSIRGGLRSSLKMVREVMKARTPTYKGSLKRSIGTIIKIDQAAGDGFGVVGPFLKVVDGSGKKRSQSYKALWLEYGTVNMKQQPFIQPSLKSVQRDIAPEFMKAIEKAIRKHGL